MNTFEKLDNLLALANDIKSEINDRIDYIKNNVPKTNDLADNRKKVNGTFHYVISDLEILQQTTFWLNNVVTINRIKDILKDIDEKIENLEAH